jgi:hypothetical protein
MNFFKTACLIPLALCCACASGSRNSAQTAGSAAAERQAAANKNPFELTIKPATATVTGGQRLPLQFTIRNTGDQTIHACLSHGRVVHLWGIDKEYAYTVAERSGDRPSCDETLDLAPRAEHSWTEDISIPSIASSSAKIVGFAQIVQPESCGPTTDCQPVWLSASFAPFTIQGPAAAPGPVLDLRTGARLAVAASFH